MILFPLSDLEQLYSIPSNVCFHKIYLKHFPISSLTTSIIFIKAILLAFDCASAMVQYSEPAVVGLLLYWLLLCYTMAARQLCLGTLYF